MRRNDWHDPEDGHWDTYEDLVIVFDTNDERPVDIGGGGVTVWFLVKVGVLLPRYPTGLIDLGIPSTDLQGDWQIVHSRMVPDEDYGAWRTQYTVDHSNSFALRDFHVAQTVTEQLLALGWTFQDAKVEENYRTYLEWHRESVAEHLARHGKVVVQPPKPLSKRPQIDG